MPAGLRGRMLGIDFGSARTGVALSDASGTIARPLEPVQRAGSSEGMHRVIDLMAAHEVTLVVVGVPRSLTGGDSRQAAQCRSFAERLRRACTVPVHMFDERYTTRMADQTARSTGSRASRDSLAACHLLELWMEEHAR